jgi:mannose-1-phosphate guanylyltransferase
VHIYPLILSGGSGTRLWPMSREVYPKQFLPLLKGRRPLQATLGRLKGGAVTFTCAAMLLLGALAGPGGRAWVRPPGR